MGSWLTGPSALSFIQCFDSVGSVTRTASGLSLLSTEVLEQLEEENQEEQVDVEKERA